MAANDQDPQNVTGASAAPEQTPEQVASYWLNQIEFTERKLKQFRSRGKQIVRRYKNKRTQTTSGVPLPNRRMNVLWSNVQTQMPVLFNQTPKANVSRRNKTKDPVGRQASIVLQNCLQNSIGMEDFDFIMRQCVQDKLLPGAGLAMVEYRPQIEADQIGWQAAETVYVHWEDWLTNIARTWQEVKWWAPRVFQTRKEVYDSVLALTKDKEWAQHVRMTITLDHREDQKTNATNDQDDGVSKATIYPIWSKTDKKVIVVSTGFREAPLAVVDPPVNFDGFFPIPRPLQSTTATDSTIPVPDFDQYVDQADEIDMLTQRIGMLAKSLRLRGLYPADMEAVKALMEANDQDLIPYDQWQMIMERGGVEALVLWFPVETIAATLVQCYNAREQAIQVMYQITGISDIIRGATDAGETATAQQLKAQFGGIRIRESQKEVQRFIRDILCKKAEVIAEHFTLEVIQKMSGVKLLTQQQKQTIQQFQQFMQQYQQQAQMAQQQGLPVPPPPSLPQPTPEMMEAMKEPTWEEVMGLLRDEKLRGFVVDVETDSTVEPDQQAQQESAVQFVTAVTQFMTAALPIVQAAPEAASFIGEMMSWTTRQWKGADTIEGAVDEFVEQMEKASTAPKPPPPEQMKADAEVKKADASVKVAEIGVQQAQVELAGDVMAHQHGMERLAAETAAAAQSQPNGSAVPGGE